MTKEYFLANYCPDRHGTNCSKWDILPEKYGDASLTSMWVADMDFKAPEAVVKALRDKVDFGVYGYSLTRKEYYDAFIDWEKKYHGWQVEKDWIRFTPGVVTGIFWCIHMLTQKGDSVIMNMPVYYPFHHAVEDTGRTLIYSELINTDGVYTIDFADIEEKIVKNNVKAYILCSPHNPVGRVWREEELKKLLSICQKYGVIVISDEIHHDLIIGDHPHIPTASVAGGKYADIVICLTAAYKTFNLAGMKNSFVIIPGEELRRKFDELVRNLHEDTGNMLGYYAIEAAYREGRAWLDTVIGIIRDNYAYTAKRLQEELPKAKLSPLEGTYLAWLDLSGYLGKTGEAEMKDFVQSKARLAVDYGEWFGAGGRGFIRLNLATTPQWVEKAVDGLVEAARSL